MAGVRCFDEDSSSQQRTFKGPIMKSAEIRAMTARLDVLRDIMVELVAAMPSHRAAGFGAALGDRLASRVYDMEVDERTDDAMVSDLAPVFAALRQRPIDTQDCWRGIHQAVRKSVGSV